MEYLSIKLVRFIFLSFFYINVHSVIDKTDASTEKVPLAGKKKESVKDSYGLFAFCATVIPLLEFFCKSTFF